MIANLGMAAAIRFDGDLRRLLHLARSITEITPYWRMRINGHTCGPISPKSAVIEKTLPRHSAIEGHDARSEIVPVEFAYLACLLHDADAFTGSRTPVTDNL